MNWKIILGLLAIPVILTGAAVDAFFMEPGLMHYVLVCTWEYFILSFGVWVGTTHKEIRW